MKYFYKKIAMTLFLLVSMAFSNKIGAMKKGEYILACRTSNRYILILDVAEKGEKVLKKIIPAFPDTLYPFSSQFNKDGKYLIGEMELDPILTIPTGFPQPRFKPERILKIWDTKNWKLIGTGPKYGGSQKWENTKEIVGFPLPYGVLNLEKDPKSSTLTFELSYGDHSTIEKITKSNLNLESTKIYDDNYTHKIISPDFKYIVIYQKNAVRVCNIKTGKCLTEKLKGLLPNILSTCFSSDGKYLAVNTG
ncbi:hypothetical protein ACFLYU_01125, partial [Candidatus Dependentiae bacterium]